MTIQKQSRDRCHGLSDTQQELTETLPWNKKDTNQVIYKTEQTHRYRKQTFGYQREKG